MVRDLYPSRRLWLKYPWYWLKVKLGIHDMFFYVFCVNHNAWQDVIAQLRYYNEVRALFPDLPPEPNEKVYRGIYETVAMNKIYAKYFL